MLDFRRVYLIQIQHLLKLNGIVLDNDCYLLIIQIQHLLKLNFKCFIKKIYTR